LPDAAYITKCFHYIHNNPVAAGLVTEPEEWKWSSYRFYIGKRKKSFCNKELAHNFLGIEKINQTK
jgi:putative transposase